MQINYRRSQLPWSQQYQSTEGNATNATNQTTKTTKYTYAHCTDNNRDKKGYTQNMSQLRHRPQ